MSENKLGIVLHAHMPFVRHVEYPRFLEEDWLFESISESYLPLLRMLERLKNDGVRFRLAISLSPTLCAMLSDSALQERFYNYLLLHKALGEKELKRCSESGNETFLPLAEMYCEKIRQNMETYYDKYGKNILSAFAQYEKDGYLELITTAATHAYLPIYRDYPIAVDAQIETAIFSHLKYFGKAPRGFWLPECGYYPGLEERLKKQGVEYFHVATQALMLSQQNAKRGCYAPVRCPNGTVAFAREAAISSLVWDNNDGYPADPDYREFYRDIGFDLPMDYIRPFIHEPEVRVFTGFKYWAISEGQNKKPYNPEAAGKKVRLHAQNFLYQVEKKCDEVRPLIDTDPYITASFDAELFGHWWAEGIDWLEAVIRGAAEGGKVRLLTQSDYIDESKKSRMEYQVMQPAFSSWGEDGYSSVWVDSRNCSEYRHIHKAIERMEELADRFPDQKSLKQRFLNQAGREVLLAMASDWPFIIHNQTSAGYAQKRLTDHLKSFNLVYENMSTNTYNTEWLIKAEKKNVLFPDFDYNIFSADFYSRQL